MPELLLELGCEELPASFVRNAYEQLADGIEERLKAQGIGFGGRTAMGTPRRLIVSFADVDPRQPDREKTQRGPSIASAFDEKSQPTPALLGFCRGQGVEPSELVREGDYVWAKKLVTGGPTAEILQTLLPEAIVALTFEKSMRWSSSKLRFARPIRWILAGFDGKAVAFEIESVHSGLQSRGHRFESPESFEATSLFGLLSGLRERMVEPDPAVREERIREGARLACSAEPMLPTELVDENVFVTEWPSAQEGSFKLEYLELPKPVLVTAMAKHEKFFPVQDASGNLTNKFISIRNGGQEDVVREGNAWVLNARFSDAKFFFDEDRKLTLDGFLETTARIVFQDRLGSVRQRADRLEKLAAVVATNTSASEDELRWARQAAFLSKADLSTGLVSDLPSLQGVIGGEYARREGLPDEVCWAIASHYDLSRNLLSDCAGTRTALRLMITDQLDKLAGFLGLGLEPTGSSDPFGLRRAATTLITAALRMPPRPRPFEGAFHAAIQGYSDQGIELDATKAMAAFKSSLCSRYEGVFGIVRYDFLAAALRSPEDDACLDPQGIRLSLACLESLSSDTEFVQSATRPLNIVSAARDKNVAFAREISLSTIEGKTIDSEPGLALLDVMKTIEQPLYDAASSGNPEAVVSALRHLQKPINEFFDSTMIMVEDSEVRTARLGLLQGCCDMLLIAGDFSKVVQEGA